MLDVSNAIDRISNSLSIDNAKKVLSWSLQNKNISLPIVIPVITATVSKALLNLSNQSTTIASSISFIVTVVDQKYPNAKTRIFEKTKTISNWFFNLYKEKKHSLIATQIKDFITSAKLMYSFLEFNKDQFLEEFNKKDSALNNTFTKLALTSDQKEIIKNSFTTYPKSKKDDVSDYNERVQKFISMFPNDERFLFNNIFENLSPKEKA